MPIIKPGLTDTFLKNLNASKTKQKKFSDGGGLFIYLRSSGSKLWQMYYRFQGKQKVLSFGEYPHVSLQQARKKRDDAKALLAQDVDPAAQKQMEKQIAIIKTQHTFEKIAREWFEKNEPNWAASTSHKNLGFLEKDVFPHMGQRPVNEITAPEVLNIIRRIEARGVLETAHRVLSCCGQIMRYAIATGRAEQDVTAFLRGALQPAKRKHYPTITNPKEVSQLLRAIDDYQGHFTVACALKLLPLVFLRPGELRKGEWSEFDFAAKEWRIPKNRMKMGEQHIVPLSRQVLAILQDLRKVTGADKYLFPSMRTIERPMSDNTLNSALRRLGYTKDEICPHGFRAMASTLLNELGYNRDWIERQLSHGERDAIRAAYNHAEFLPERRKMMQDWSDYLDKLKSK